MNKKNKNETVNIVHNEDARKLSKIIPPGIKIMSTITSPPYYDMKDYGSKNQVGHGQSYQLYLEDLKSIFKSIFDITNDDGTLWIIIDTFKRNNQVVTLPFDLSNKLKETGWLLQDVIIWKKDKTVPWSNNGFMQRKFEYILFFSKSVNYKSKKDDVRVFDTSQLKKWWVKYPERYNPKGKALDEVWEFPIPTQGSWGEEYIRHFCPLPKEMVATMIQISSDENDIILDPFAGSGTVLSQSAYMNRNYIGFELNNSYIDMFKKYIKKTFKIGRDEYQRLSTSNAQQEFFETQIIELRILKYARLLLNFVAKSTNNNNLKIFASYRGKSLNKNKVALGNYEIIGNIDKDTILPVIDNFILSPPLSKFGIDAKFLFSDDKKINRKKHFGYSATNTHSYLKNISLDSSKVKVISDIKIDLNENDYS